jgi:hypothetical protein
MKNIFLENTYIWSARFFSRNIFLPEVSRKFGYRESRKSPYFSDEIIQTKFKFNFFERHQIYFYRSLLQLHMQHSGKSSS